MNTILLLLIAPLIDAFHVSRILCSRTSTSLTKLDYTSIKHVIDQLERPLDTARKVSRWFVEPASNRPYPNYTVEYARNFQNIQTLFILAIQEMASVVIPSGPNYMAQLNIWLQKCSTYPMQMQHPKKVQDLERVIWLSFYVEVRKLNKSQLELLSAYIRLNLTSIGWKNGIHFNQIIIDTFHGLCPEDRDSFLHAIGLEYIQFLVNVSSARLMEKFAERRPYLTDKVHGYHFFRLMSMAFKLSKQNRPIYNDFYSAREQFSRLVEYSGNELYIEEKMFMFDLYAEHRKHIDPFIEFLYNVSKSAKVNPSQFE